MATAVLHTAEWRLQYYRGPHGPLSSVIKKSKKSVKLNKINCVFVAVIFVLVAFFSFFFVVAFVEVVVESLDLGYEAHSGLRLRRSCDDPPLLLSLPVSLCSFVSTFVCRCGVLELSWDVKTL